MKTKKAAAKRMKVTGSGKIKTRHARIGHLRRRKTKRAVRKLLRSEVCAPADRKTMQRCLPYGS